MSRFRPDLSDEPAVRMDGVSLTYERTGEVLSEIDLVLKQGSFTFLTGPSGAGKSSLLMVMGGLEQATGGTVHALGQDLTAMNEDALARFRQGRMGIVFQSFHLVLQLGGRLGKRCVCPRFRADEHPLQGQQHQHQGQGKRPLSGTRIGRHRRPCL